MKLSIYTSEFKKNLQIAYPVMLGQLGHVLVGLADNLMVGKLGAVALAATSLAGAFVFIFLSLGIGFSFSITTLTAEANGAKDTNKTREILKHGIVITGLWGVFITILLFIVKPVLSHMGQESAVVEVASNYYDIIAISMIPVMFFQGLKQFSDGLSFTKLAMTAMIISNIINVILNYTLIYGKFGFPELGVQGAAIGTLISRCVQLGLMVYFIFTQERFKPYVSQFTFKNLNKKIFMKIFKIGYPTALQMWFETGLFIACVFLSGVLGANSQAANQIAQNLITITFMIAIGLGVTATVRVGYQKGSKNYKELRRIAFSLFFLSIIIMSFFALVFVVSKDILPTYYTNNIEVIKIASTLIIISGFFQLSDGIQVVVLGTLRGMQDVLVPMGLTFVAYWVIGFPISYYLGLHTELKTAGIWIGLLISLTASALMLFLRFNYLSKKLILESKEETMTIGKE